MRLHHPLRLTARIRGPRPISRIPGPAIHRRSARLQRQTAHHLPIRHRAHRLIRRHPLRPQRHRAARWRPPVIAARQRNAAPVLGQLIGPQRRQRALLRITVPAGAQQGRKQRIRVAPLGHLIGADLRPHRAQRRQRLRRHQRIARQQLLAQHVQVHPVQPDRAQPHRAPQAHVESTIHRRMPPGKGVQGHPVRKIGFLRSAHRVIQHLRAKRTRQNPANFLLHQVRDRPLVLQRRARRGEVGAVKQILTHHNDHRIGQRRAQRPQHRVAIALHLRQRTPLHPQRQVIGPQVHHHHRRRLRDCLLHHRAPVVRDQRVRLVVRPAANGQVNHAHRCAHHAHARLPQCRPGLRLQRMLRRHRVANHHHLGRRRVAAPAREGRRQQQRRGRQRKPHLVRVAAAVKVIWRERARARRHIDLRLRAHLRLPAIRHLPQQRIQRLLHRRHARKPRQQRCAHLVRARRRVLHLLHQDRQLVRHVLNRRRVEATLIGQPRQLQRPHARRHRHRGSRRRRRQQVHRTPRAALLIGIEQRLIVRAQRQRRARAIGRLAHHPQIRGGVHLEGKRQRRGRAGERARDAGSGADRHGRRWWPPCEPSRALAHPRAGAPSMLGRRPHQHGRGRRASLVPGLPSIP